MPFDGIDDGIVGLARAGCRARDDEDVLAAGRRRIVVVDNEDDAVLLVEHGVADADVARPLCQKPPSPITEIGALVGGDVEGGSGGRAEAIAHRRRCRC